MLQSHCITQEPLLTITQQMIEADKQLTHICPGDLLLAGLNFVLALWFAGREKVTQQLATRFAYCLFYRTVEALLREFVCLVQYEGAWQ